MLETTVEVMCPNCGETILLFVDLSVEAQSYIEDCAVCCRPMTISYTADENGLQDLNVESAD